MRDKPISGRLAGEYKIDLACRFSANQPETNRRLRAVLVIDEAGGWHMRFEIEAPSVMVTSQNLSAMIREFDR